MLSINKGKLPIIVTAGKEAEPHGIESLAQEQATEISIKAGPAFPPKKDRTLRGPSPIR